VVNWVAGESLGAGTGRDWPLQVVQEAIAGVEKAPDERGRKLGTE
jgi:hypothetical protein